jgi:hypothetical protein
MTSFQKLVMSGENGRFFRESGGETAVFVYTSRMDAQKTKYRVDKTAFSVVSLHDESDEVAYWLTKTAAERLQAIELMRQVLYGYDPSTTRFQRVFAVVERETS